MERFKVSGQDLRNFYNEANTPLSRVFHDIEQDLRATNQVVCRYIINGLEISERDEERFSRVPLADIETLEYLTENSRDITSMVLRGWIEALPELIDKTEKLAQRMRGQGLSGLLKAIHDVVRNFEYLIESTVAIKSTLGDQLSSQDNSQWSQIEGLSKQTVLQAIEALGRKDFVLLADILEYDLINVLQLWHGQLQTLESFLDGDCAKRDDNANKDGSHSLGGKRLAN